MTRKQLTRVAPENAEQARAWDGDEGDYWARHADRFDAALTRHQPRFLETAAIGPTDAVLDIGCGTGRTTRDAARAAHQGTALGVDLGLAMLDVARRRAAEEGLTNVHFERADAQVHPFPSKAFDVMISRTGTMFFGDPEAAFANIARALKPGAQTTQLVWQSLESNEWVTSFSRAMAAGRDLPAPPPGAPGPFSFGEPRRLRALLEATGFIDVQVEELREPMYFGATAGEATTFIGGLLAWMLAGLDEAGRRRALADLHTTMADHEGPDGVLFASAAWLVTALRA